MIGSRKEVVGRLNYWATAKFRQAAARRNWIKLSAPTINDTECEDNPQMVGFEVVIRSEATDHWKRN